MRIILEEEELRQSLISTPRLALNEKLFQNGVRRLASPQSVNTPNSVEILMATQYSLHISRLLCELSKRLQSGKASFCMKNAYQPKLIAIFQLCVEQLLILFDP